MILRCALTGLAFAFIILLSFPLQAGAQFCHANETKPCPSIGICNGSARLCIDGAWGDCEGGVQSEKYEICGNGLDDNCNGLVDECESPWLLMVGAGIFLLVMMGLLMKMGY